MVRGARGQQRPDAGPREPIGAASRVVPPDGLRRAADGQGGRPARAWCHVSGAAGLLLIAAATLVAGCSSYGTGPYQPLRTKVRLLNSASGSRGVAVGPFTAASPRQTELQCRAAGRIGIPDDSGFESFIRQALIVELEGAGLLSNTGRIITGHVGRVDVATVIPMGRWTIELTLASSNGRTLNHMQTHDYSVGGVGEDPCLATASEFVPAVQGVIRALFERADFVDLLK